MPIPGGSPPYPTALVTLDDVYDHLQIPVAEQDALASQLQGFIDAATSVITDVAGPIIPQEFTEVHNGGGNVIIVNNPPILSVSSITEYVGPTAYTLTESELGGAGGQYSFSIDNADQGIIRRRWSGGLVGPFAGGNANVSVTYVAGRATVDPEIRMAVLMDLQGLFTQSQYGGGSSPFGGEIGEGVAEQWSGAPMNLFPRLLSVLQAAKRRTPAIA